MEFLQLSGEFPYFPYAHESGHSFTKAFISVRIIKLRRQFVQPQADFRRHSIVATQFCSDSCANSITEPTRPQKFSALAKKSLNFSHAENF